MHTIFPIVCLLLLIAMIVLQRVSYGYQVLHRKDVQKVGSGAIEAAIFALLGLLVALTFSGAQTRYEQRSQIIVEEANAIQTAYMRLDLLPDSSRDSIRKKFKEYIESRIDFFNKTDREALEEEISRGEKIQREMWDLAIIASQKASDTTVRMLILPAMNQMFDIMTKRTFSLLTHTSIYIFIMFFSIMIICSILSGMSMAKTGKFSWVYAILFASVTVITVYMILDLEYPRVGLIRIDYAQNAFINLRNLL